jgi:hypothetical protein
MRSSFFSILTAVLLLSCDKAPTQVESPLEGALGHRIVGTWRAPTSTKVFNADGSFVDSTFYVSPDGLVRRPTIVWRGRFQILDSLLSYADVFPMFQDSVFFEAQFFAVSFGKQKIDWCDDSLSFHRIARYHPVGTIRPPLQGTWQNDAWICELSTGNTFFVYCGRMITTLVISGDSMWTATSFPDGYHFPYPATKGLFRFNPPFIEIGRRSLLVEFKQSDMIWHYSDQADYYRRIN